MAKIEKPSKDYNKGELRFVPLDNLVTHPEIHNREIHKEHVALLTESIARDGLDTPLLIWNGGDPAMEVELANKKKIPATFIVGGGHRNKALRAFRKADKEAFEKAFPKGIPCHMIQGDLKDALAAQLRENAARENPTGEEILPFVQRLKDEFKMKNTKIAKAVGRSDAWVSEVLDIGKHLGSDATEKVIKGEIGLSDAVKAAKKVKKGKQSKEDALDEAVEKTNKKKKKGSKKSDKRIGMKALYARYKALPGLKLGQRIQVLEAAFEYAVGDTDVVPELLRSSDEDTSDVKKTKKKKSKE